MSTHTFSLDLLRRYYVVRDRYYGPSAISENSLPWDFTDSGVAFYDRG